MGDRLRLLLVEDNTVDHMAFERLVEREGLPYDYRVAASIADAREILTDEQFDIVLLDYRLGDGTAFDLLDAIDETPSLVITGLADTTIAVEAMKRGVYDYLAKDSTGDYLTALPIVVEQTLDRDVVFDDQGLDLLSQLVHPVGASPFNAFLAGELSPVSRLVTPGGDQRCPDPGRHA